MRALPSHPVASVSDDVWNCTDAQKAQILELTAERHLDLRAIEALAKEGFGVPVKVLNEAQASRLIDELFSAQGKDHGSLCCLKSAGR